MKTKILIVYLLALSSITFAQTHATSEILQTKWDNSNEITPGDLLISSAKQVGYSFACGVVAGGFAYWNVNNENPQESRMLNFATGVFAVASFTYSVISVVNIGRAGVLLNENGIGIKVTL